MGPVQPNATDHNPNNLPMIVGATYNREIGASLARAWENVLDWEHLPHLHSSSFSSLALQEAGSWGWRALTVGHPATKASEALIELVVDRDRGRYVSRTLSGGIPGMEIWTQLSEIAAHRTQVDVEFHIPNMTADNAQKLGQYMVTLYKTLWDEDERMMVERQTALDARNQTPNGETITLGPRDQVMKQVPLCLTLAGTPVKLVNLSGTLVAFRPECPHMLAPLDQAEIDQDGCITCPWHGYKFDVESGLSTDGHNLSLGGNFIISTDKSGNLSISNSHSAANR